MNVQNFVNVQIKLYKKVVYVQFYLYICKQI